jgi:hypothetical protein
VSEALLLVVFALYSLSDSAQDKLNSAKWKRPNHSLPWPLVDVWHAIKKFRLYILPVYMIALYVRPSLVPTLSLPLVGILIVACYAVWKLVPVPEHWRR